jgi:acid phosphatase type 7
MRNSEMGRMVALAVVAFAATLLVLVGLMAVVDRSRSGAASASPSGDASTGATTSPPASGTAGPSGDPSPLPSASEASTPAPTPVPDAVLVGAGDIAGCDWDTDEATAALLDDIEGTIFTAGDNVYPEGTDETFDECFDPSWGRHLDRIRPAPGNHDWQTGSLDAYLDYFGEAAVNEDGDPWYAYDLGAWRIIVLDSDCEDAEDCGPESDQGRWLADELATTTARCTLAIWHVPRYSSGFHGDDTDVQPLWDALYEAGADVIVNGHDHDYERFAPLDANGDEDRERGMRQFIVGTGGVALREFEEPAPHSELRLGVTQGVIAFTLKDGGYEWSWIPTEGDVGDRGSATCH